MALTVDQDEVLKLMKGIVESYETLSIGSAHTLHHLALDYFKKDIDIAPAIAAVRSRRGDRIYGELKRLNEIIDRLRKSPA